MYSWYWDHYQTSTAAATTAADAADAAADAADDDDAHASTDNQS